MATRKDVAFETERLLLREPRPTDAEDLCAYYARNAERFERWEPERSADPAVHAATIADVRLRADRGEGVHLFVTFERDRPQMIAGTVSLDGFSAIPPSAMIAYSIDATLEGRGLASEAVARVVRYAFAELALGELSAFYDPRNARSEALLVRIGFTPARRAPAIPGVEHLMRSNAVATLRKRADG